MIRVPYSLHEKSGLASLPLKINQLKSFKKGDAKPEKVKVEIEFLSRNADSNEATELLSLALSHRKEEKRKVISDRKLERPTTKLPQEHFPPCIKNILKGVQDGRKRSEFILRCFLYRVGYNWEEIQNILLEWNKKNPTPLKENYLIGQLKWHMKQQRGIMPPNCNNDAYYKDFRVCNQIKACAKNPVVTALRIARDAKRDKKKKRGKSK
jgi:DNA primase large subunit